MTLMQQSQSHSVHLQQILYPLNVLESHLESEGEGECAQGGEKDHEREQEREKEQ
jgi:hypothetical protein